MTFNVQENAVFIYTNKKKIVLNMGGPQSHTLPRSVASIPFFAPPPLPPLTNPSCTIVTGIAKGTMTHT